MTQPNEAIKKMPLESLAEARLTYILLNWKGNLDNTTATAQDVSRSLLKVLKQEFGYRPIDSSKLTVLNDEEISIALDKQAGTDHDRFIFVAQTQLAHTKKELEGTPK